ncbi:MAG: SH3 domain-containing protein [Anaerobutyricum sp.]|nr:SH3 domain-containing protein [Anaerobutyricum sp.]
MKAGKKIFITTLMVISVAALAGCGNSEKETKVPAETTTQTVAEAEATTQVTTEATTQAKEATTQAVAEVKMFTTEDINLKKKDNKDSKTLSVIPLGEKVKLVKEGEEWTQVEYKGQTGFVYTEYLTKKKSDVKKAKEAKAEEEAAAQAAAEAEAAAAEQESKQSSSNSSKSSSGGSSKKKVVSKTKNDDCDGSGHGYYEIKYSDGSTSIKEY